MSLARRLMMSSANAVSGGGPVGQVEYTLSPGYALSTPETFTFTVPVGVTKISVVGIAAGMASTNTSPFRGTTGGNLHWRNDIPVTPGEDLTVSIGTHVGNIAIYKETSLKRGSTYLTRAGNSGGGSGMDYYLALGGGGGRGGTAHTSSGLGGGGPGYTGQGGRGGSYDGTVPSTPPEPESGGGRGGDRFNTYGWSNVVGEGTGLLGRSPDKTTSLGPKLYGAGTWGGAGENALPGGLRIMWGDVRSYPDNAPDAF